MVQLILISQALLVAAALMEMGGGYLVWRWSKEKKNVLVGIVGGLILFGYGVIPTLQSASFGRVYAAYGGIFIVSSILWGALIDKKMPDRYEVIGAFITLVGALIIFYTPR